MIGGREADTDRFIMLVELSVVEQRYRAVLEVIKNRRPVV